MQTGQSGLQDSSTNPFMGVNLPELDIFHVDPNTLTTDCFDDIPLPLPTGTSINDAFPDLDSIDMSSL